MKKTFRIIFLTLLVCVVSSQFLYATIIYSADSDDWNDTDTWVGGVIPTSMDTAIIDGHTIFIEGGDSVAVQRLEINNTNTGAGSNSKLELRNTARLRVLGNVNMTAGNEGIGIELKGRDFSKIYIDGDMFMNRLPSNTENDKLKLYLTNTTELIVKGSMTYTYENSGGGENNEEILVKEFAKMVVEGVTTFHITGGVSFHTLVTDSGYLGFEGGLNVYDVEGDEVIFESDATGVFKIIGDANFINSNSDWTSWDMLIRTGTNGGTIIVDGDLKLEATEFESKVILESEEGIPTIIVTGDLIFSANYGSTSMVKLGGSATFKLGGDISRTNDFGDLEMADFAVFEFNGDSLQNIPSTTVVGAEIDSILLQNVVFNNPNGFVLEGDLTIFDSLNLTNGIFVTEDDKMLILAEGAKTSIGNDSAYVDGPMTKIGVVQDEPFVFPLGDNGKYAPVEIVPLGSSTTSSYTAKYDKCPPPFDKITSAPLSQISATQFWTIERTAGSQNFDVVLHWQDAAAEGINDLDSLVVASLNPTLETWETMGNGGTTGGTGSGIAGSVKNDDKCPPPFDRINFTFGSHPASSNALPSEIISFEGKKVGQNIRLDWVTASEISSDLFIVERSTNGEPFEKINTVDAQGNSNSFQHYRIEDKFPVEGVNYYRLQRVDLDGSTLPTEIVAVNFSQEKIQTRVYPNPVQDIVNIVLENDVEGEIQIEVHNQNGQRIFEGSFDVTGNQLNLPIEQLNIKSRGSYTILYHNNDRTETLRFVKVN